MGIDMEKVKRAARPISPEGSEKLLRPKAGMDVMRNAERTIGLISHNVHASMDGVMLGEGTGHFAIPRDAIGL